MRRVTKVKYLKFPQRRFLLSRLCAHIGYTKGKNLRAHKISAVAQSYSGVTLIDSATFFVISLTQLGKHHLCCLVFLCYARPNTS